MLNVVMPSVVMLNVVVPVKQPSLTIGSDAEGYTCGAYAPALLSIIKQCFLVLIEFIIEDTKAIQTIITTTQLKLNEIKFRNYLQK
jgi:hypothetical protein